MVQAASRSRIRRALEGGAWKCSPCCTSIDMHMLLAIWFAPRPRFCSKWIRPRVATYRPIFLRCVRAASESASSWLNRRIATPDLSPRPGPLVTSRSAYTDTSTPPRRSLGCRCGARENRKAVSWFANLCSACSASIDARASSRRMADSDASSARCDRVASAVAIWRALRLSSIRYAHAAVRASLYRMMGGRDGNFERRTIPIFAVSDETMYRASSFALMRGVFRSVG